MSLDVGAVVDDAAGTSSSLDFLTSLEEHTDIAEWINDLLDTRSSVQDVTSLTTRLEVACQDTSSQLERTIDDISRTVPRLTYDLHFLRESTLSLKVALSFLQTRLASSLADEDTTKALDRLANLDTIKRHMESSRDVLKEAESWSTMEPEVTTLLAELQYAKAAERLAEARRSIPVFQNTPAYEPRRALMTSLQNQLEAALSAALVAAINKRDIGACKSYYGVFANIQREAEFRNYYYGSRRSTLVKMWSEAILVDIDGEEPSSANGDSTSTSPVKFTTLLSNFFTSFLALLDEERTYISSIFPDPQQTLSAFVQSTMDALTPPFSQRLSGLVDHYSLSALPELMIAFRSTEEFAVATDKVLEKVGYTALFSPAIEEANTPPKTPTHSRRLSKRMSMSRRLNSNRSQPSISGKIVMGTWEQVLFEPFLDLQAEYEQLEKRMLGKGLEDLRIVSKDVGGEEQNSARAFRAQSVDVFSLAEEALARCMDFTHGYGAVGMLNAIDKLLGAFLDDARVDLTLSSPSSSISHSTVPDEALLTDLDYTPNDWYTIQRALHMLDACRAVNERLGLLTQKIRGALVQVASAFKLGRQDSQGVYIAGTTRGELQLLSQSTLNSVELNTLLDGLDFSGAGNTNSALVTTPSPSITPAILTPAGVPNNTSASASSHLLLGAQTALQSLTRSAQSTLSSTLLSPLMRHLTTYTSLNTWSSPGSSTSSLAANDLKIPTFSLSPTPTMQRLAEGLLNLPRLFEVYAEDDALAFGVALLPYVQEMTTQDYLGVDLDPEAHLAPETIISMWLTSLARSLLAHLTDSVLPSIEKGKSGQKTRGLSPTGQAQLESDMEYLGNVVRALGVEWVWKNRRESIEENGEKTEDGSMNGETPLSPT
ncbi:hypothetical protein M422DRAFT_27443 [Sphaerobolus stellatus SS14]|nr:hypothetical protein M422DRAFT_27443 [Sphaerobolus stellatus SS14]